MKRLRELTRIRNALKKINDACCGHVDDDASHCSILRGARDEEHAHWILAVISLKRLRIWL